MMKPMRDQGRQRVEVSEHLFQRGVYFGEPQTIEAKTVYLFDGALPYALNLTTAAPPIYPRAFITGGTTNQSRSIHRLSTEYEMPHQYDRKLLLNDILVPKHWDSAYACSLAGTGYGFASALIFGLSQTTASTAVLIGCLAGACLGFVLPRRWAVHRATAIAVGLGMLALVVSIAVSTPKPYWDSRAPVIPLLLFGVTICIFAGIAEMTFAATLDLKENDKTAVQKNEVTITRQSPQRRTGLVEGILVSLASLIDELKGKWSLLLWLLVGLYRPANVILLSSYWLIYYMFINDVDWITLTPAPTADVHYSIYFKVLTLLTGLHLSALTIAYANKQIVTSTLKKAFWSVVFGSLPLLFFLAIGPSVWLNHGILNANGAYGRVGGFWFAPTYIDCPFDDIRVVNVETTETPAFGTVEYSISIVKNDARTYSTGWRINLHLDRMNNAIVRSITHTLSFSQRSKVNRYDRFPDKRKFPFEGPQ